MIYNLLNKCVKESGICLKSQKNINERTNERTHPYKSGRVSSGAKHLEGLSATILCRW